MKKANRSKIEWLVVPAPDLEAASRFYQDIFGFEISSYSENYRIFKAFNISGGLDKNLKPSRNGIRFSITVNNFQKTIVEIIRLGGKILKEPYPIGQGSGYCALCEDVCKNVFELYTESSLNNK